MGKKKKLKKRAEIDTYNRDIKEFSKVHNISEVLIKKAIDVMAYYVPENSNLEHWESYLENNKIPIPSKKLIGMLTGSGNFIIDKINGGFFHKSQMNFSTVKKNNHIFYVGEREIRRRYARSGEVNESILYDFLNEKLVWKDLSELEENNDFSRIVGKILVTGAWDEDEPKPNYETCVVEYQCGWAYPSLRFVYPGTDNLWPYASKIEKWMHFPEYKAWEK